MARRRSSASAIRVVQAPRQPAPVIRVVAPSAPRAPGRLRRAVRRVASSGVGRAASSEKHTLIAIGTAAALGLGEKTGMIPMSLAIIPGVGPAGTLGLAAWAIGRITKNQTAQHMATGLLCVAVNQWARTGTVSGELGGTVVGFDEE